MVQSVELLLDDALDAAVRTQWERLRAAGLPGQADHRGPTNAPHVTLGVADALDGIAEARLHPLAAVLPLPVRLGGLLLFAGWRTVLARVVVPTGDLLALHAEVATCLEHSPGVPATVRPAGWTPHVTLVRRLRPEQVGPAVEAVRQDRPDREGYVVALRRWDAEARRAWTVGSR